MIAAGLPSPGRGGGPSGRASGGPGAGSSAGPSSGPSSDLTLRVDRIACDGYGMCAELLPELIELDDWGYPIVRSGAVPLNLVRHARRAVDVCPVFALRLVRERAAAR